MNCKIILLAAVTVALAHAGDRLPAFETVSIKPNPEIDLTAVMDIPPDVNKVSIFGETPIEIIAFAYATSPKLVAGGPWWKAYDRYDIDAEAGGPGVLSQPERREMLRAMLAQRFQLKFHREMRTVSVYGLTRAKSGPKLKRCPAGDDTVPEIITINCPTHMWGRNASMEQLARALEPAIFHGFPEAGHHLVLDKTELEGRFDFDLAWTVSGLDRMPGPIVGSSSPLPRAIEEQLGLHLYRVKAQREVLVIDQLKRPATN